MYIPSLTFLAVLSFLLSSTAAPVHFPSVSPPSSNLFSRRDHIPLVGCDHSSCWDNRHLYASEVFKDSRDDMGRDMSNKGRSLPYLDSRQTHSPDYHNTNTTVPPLSSASSSSASSTSNQSSHRRHESGSHYEAGSDVSFESKKRPQMSRYLRPKPVKRSIIPPRQLPTLVTTTPNVPNPVLLVPHKIAHTLGLSTTDKEDAKDTASASHVSLSPLSEPNLDIPLNSNSSTNATTTSSTTASGASQTQTVSVQVPSGAPSTLSAPNKMDKIIIELGVHHHRRSFVENEIPVQPATVYRFVARN